MNKGLIKAMMKEAVAQSFSEFATEHASIAIAKDNRGGKVIGDIPMDFIVKYTELIVKECMADIERCYTSYDNDDPEHNRALRSAWWQIKDHFNIDNKIDSDFPQVKYDEEFKDEK